MPTQIANPVTGTGAEVEGRIEIGAGTAIANEGVTPGPATVISTTLDGRHPRARPALALIHLTPSVIPLWIDLHRVALPALHQAFTIIDDQTNPGLHPPVTGTFSRLGRWTETAQVSGETSHRSCRHSKGKELAVHLLVPNVARFLPVALLSPSTGKGATAAPHIRTEAVSRGAVLLGEDLLAGAGTAVGKTADVLIFRD